MHRSSVTCLEDLSNEILYDIFDYLHTYDAYQAFGNLNWRFQRLFTDSCFSHKIILDLSSKATFQQRCQYLHSGNYQNVKAIHSSSCLGVDYILSLFLNDLSAFVRLESLVLHEIEAERVLPLLTNLKHLPQLYSLSLSNLGKIKDPNTLHQLIFNLPVLKYCNTTLKWTEMQFTLTRCLNPISKIQCFISRSDFDPNILGILLSYMPQLVRLSISTKPFIQTLVSWQPIVLTNLTYFHLDHSMDFDSFEMLMSDFFHELKVLRISQNSDVDYLNAKRWQTLITTHLPRLEKFDLQHISEIPHLYYFDVSQLNEFVSPFWTQHQWFFYHTTYRYMTMWYIFFFSNISTCTSNRHITIVDDRTTIDIRASQLTVCNDENLGTILDISNLTSLIDFEGPKNLALRMKAYDRNNLMELCRAMPNVEMLVLSTYSAQLVSIDNDYDTTTALFQYTEQINLGDVQALISILPNLKSLEMNIKGDHLESIIRFLLKKKASCNHQLHVIGLRDSHHGIVRRLEKLLDREQLATNYTVKLISDTVYLWS
ncbi:unnamed protein product [Adineta ricciae]|uniref:F-box domain-containing protein n=1 Tax=Adineta ricciae TaxID=249248 RepID=A0A813QL12_ADIRI|nr:unnamed protein product [Adineta ricciae]CAF1283385.1 unnamed protein product [Adineta ricciae]